jgi:tRNA(Ser,Leu) C12 N-acetylase TAN1
VSWNVVATCHEGRRDALLASLRRLAGFRPGGYRNVVVARVDDPITFLDRVRDALGEDRVLAGALGKLVPIDVRCRIGPEEAVDQLTEAAEPLLDRLAGGSFFVRVERRGLKGRLDTSAVERAVGDGVWRALAARGGTPRVDFADADAVLVIETLGDQAGLAVLDRRLRREYPFVRIR